MVLLFTAAAPVALSLPCQIWTPLNPASRDQENLEGWLSKEPPLGRIGQVGRTLPAHLLPLPLLPPLPLHLLLTTATRCRSRCRTPLPALHVPLPPVLCRLGCWSSRYPTGPLTGSSWSRYVGA